MGRRQKFLTGLIILPLIVPSVAASLIGSISDNHGPRWLIFSEILLLTLFWTHLYLLTHNSLARNPPLSAILSLFGVSPSVIMTTLMAEITYVVQAEKKPSLGLFGPFGAYAQAYGLCEMSYEMRSVGSRCAGFVADVAGWMTMILSLGSFTLKIAVASSQWVRRSLRSDESQIGSHVQQVIADRGLIWIPSACYKYTLDLQGVVFGPSDGGEADGLETNALSLLPLTVGGWLMPNPYDDPNEIVARGSQTLTLGLYGDDKWHFRKPPTSFSIKPRLAHRVILHPHRRLSIVPEKLLHPVYRYEIHVAVALEKGHRERSRPRHPIRWYNVFQARSQCA